MLAVAHRLSTLVDFDRLVVLVDGRVVEDGSPAELRHGGGAFETLCGGCRPKACPTRAFPNR